jgi:protein arginine kinase
LILACPALNPVALGEHPEFDVIVRSFASVDRNVEGMPFPHTIDDGRRIELNVALASAARAVGLGTARSGDLEQSFRFRLVERELYSRPYLLRDDAIVALDPGSSTWIAFNDDNHVSIRGEDPGLNLETVLERVLVVDSRLSAGLGDKNWAFDAEFGFIMAEAVYCGSGLAASVTLHAPALVLSGLAETAFKRAMEAGFVVTGSYSLGDASAGSLFEVSLPGVYRDPEREAVIRLTSAARALADYERRARSQMLERKPWEILDVIGRALGLAAGARLVSRDEAAGIISGLRLGLSCGVLEGLDLAEVGDLWPSSRARPIRGGGSDDEPEYALRARVLRDAARNVVFTERYRNV